ARRAGEPERYPEKAARAAPDEERWCALVATRGDRVWLLTRPAGRFHGMLVPPMNPGARRPAAWARLGNPRRAGACRHVLSHAIMNIAVHLTRLEGDPGHGSLVRASELGAHAVPRITRSILASV